MQETFTESLTSQNLDLHDFHDVSHWDVLLHQNSCMYFFFLKTCKSLIQGCLVPCLVIIHPALHELCVTERYSMTDNDHNTFWVS